MSLLKNILLLTFSGIFMSNIYAQECSGLVDVCKNNLVLGNPKFLSDGQVYSVLLNNEKAEFKTTFFGKSTYRVSVSAGVDDNYVIFTVKDLLGNIIFSNKNYNNAPYWDFEVPETIPVIIETELDIDRKKAGCVVMLIGFIQ
jgi:hypothetical protein